MDKNKILLGIPTNRQIQPLTVLSLLKMIQNTREEVIPILATQGYTISENRNYLVAQALKNNCTHLMMIDDDMVFPENTLTQLLFDNKDIVGVVANSRALPLMPVVEFFDDEELSVADKLLGKRNIPEQLFTCKAVGGGVLIINTKVFEKMSRPYFGMEIMDTGMTKTGEDSYFCYNASKVGFEIWCDPTLKINHIGNYLY